MNDVAIKQLLSDIITQAQEGKPVEFKYITSWNEFRYYSHLRKANKIVIKTIIQANHNLFKAYCAEISTGADFNKLLAYSQLCDVIAFYEKDLATIQRMLDEYDNYLGDWGNFFNAIFGGEREI